MSPIPSKDPAGFPLTIPALLRSRCATRSEHALLICDEQVLTYGSAASRSAELAKALIASGAGPGTRLGVLFPNGPEFVVAVLAAARIGAVAAPISTFSTSTELRTLLRNADIDFLLAASAYRHHDYIATVRGAVPELDLTALPPLFAPSAPALRGVAFSVAHSPIAPGWSLEALLEKANEVDDDALSAFEEAVRPSDRLVIIQTSGSTAAPKGVIHQHGALIRHVHNLNKIRRYDEHEVLFCNAPFFWVGGFAYALVGTMEAGATLVCSNAADASDVLDTLERTKPTMTNGFAQSVAQLATDPSFASRDLRSLKRGNLYPIMPEARRPADPDLRHNMLGMTEMGSVCLASEDEADQPEHRRGSFGRPVPGVEAKVVDPDTGRPRNAGEPGDLCLRGPALMEGYYGRCRDETFDADGWYHTGDVFHYDNDGYFYFQGRRAGMIKTSGANVSPLEVESAILEETGLVSHVVGIDHPTKGQVVAAAIRIPAGRPVPDSDEIRLKLRVRLSAYKVPRLMLMVSEADIPMMSSGKLDLRALKERFREQ